MPVALNGIIREGALPALQRHRAAHLAYIQAHAGEILFGGPARGPDGAPEEMLIVLRTDDLAAAGAFVAAEPYNASREVFADVKVRPWSQVVPEPTPGTLARALAEERASGA